LSLGSLEFRLALQALDKPEYAFGVKHAIDLASKLNHRRVSVVEFGVGTGLGLKTLERYAEELGGKYGVTVDVYGFDLSSGLPAPSDYRDVPYFWKAGDYKMDVESLQAELTRAKLILGDVRDSIAKFAQAKPAPIGFISFDLDYYSSTAAAFRIFDGADEMFLPRVICYFDDVRSDGRALHCEYAGELRAIKEFNELPGEVHKLCAFRIQKPVVKFDAPWLRQLWAYHRFSHAQYNIYIRD